MSEQTPLNVDFDLIQKYNVSGPRYTSYPTAVQFEEVVDRAAMDRYLEKRNAEPRPLSLYFHIPFCYSLCWYCGCTKIITKKHDRGDAYIDYLEREMDLLKPRLNPESPVVQMHFGGGTPTFLRPDQIRRLGEAIWSRFKKGDEAEVSVEIDPRRMSREHVEALRDAGFNRASLGIQDTNPAVQEAVHRIQPMEDNLNVSRWLREEGFGSLNIDLIYGLPRQTLKSFENTLKDIQQLEPDRLAVYSYAHIPRLMPAQKLLNEEELPNTDEKLGMLQLSIEFLTRNGYDFIGMDHFARSDNELSEALRNDRLHRNFQGYSTHSEADLYAFGMSGISQVDEVYFQNVKDLTGYYEALDEGRRPLFKTLWLSRDDRIRRDTIMRIMCRSEVRFDELGNKWGIDPQQYFADELEQLESLEEDGLLKRHPERLEISTTGRLFLRNIAMVFDHYLQQAGKRTFSKTV